MSSFDVFRIIQEESLGAMKKTKLTRSLLAACSIVALSAVMYGCTGSSGPSQDEYDAKSEALDQEREAHAATQVELDTAQGEVTRLTGELDTATSNAASLQTMLDDANTETMRIQGLLDAEEGNSASLQTMLDDANGEVTRIQGLLDAANNMMADLQTQLDAANARAGGLQTQLDAINNPVDSDPARTTAAVTKAEAIGDEAAQLAADDAGLGGDDGFDDDNVATYSVTISDDGTEVEVKDSALAGNNDPKFEQAMDFGDGRTMHVRAMDADNDGNVVEEVVIVSTDIKPPKATPFAMVAGQALNTRDLDANEDADGDGDAINDFTALIVADDEMDVPGLVMAGAFTSSGGTTAMLTFAHAQADGDNDTPGNQSVKAFETAGTYNGAMGTYRCNGDAVCTVTVDADNMITDVSAGWIFTPNTGATSNVDDTDYLTYGFWLQRTTDEDGVLTYDEVETFAMATGIVPTGDAGLSAVVGTATYSGGAVGVYVKNVLDDQATVVSATSGHFSADAELNASFGGGGVAANDQFTIGGTITGFDLQHGEENDWEVSLGLADFSGRLAGAVIGMTGPGDTYVDTFSGKATGDSTAVDGSWNGAFYGSSEAVDHDMDDATGEINPQPVAVIGEFNANFRDGTTAGAFGANKE